MFRAPVFDVYGMTETGPLAWQCAPGGPYHLAEDTTIVELVPSPVPGRARLVVTPLWRRVMPLVRYDTGDLAVAGDRGRCACGSPFATIARVEGRVVDCLRLPDGESLSPYAITLALEEVKGIARYRVIQESPTAFLVEIEPERRAEDAITEAVRRVLGGVLGSGVTIRVAFRDSLEPPAGRKFKVVENRLREAERLCVS